MKQPLNTSWDSSTVNNFWKRKPGDCTGESLYDSIQRRMKEEGEAPELGMTRFSTWIDNILGRFGRSLGIVSDNPGVDVGWINYYLTRFAAADPLEIRLQKHAMQYCRVLDASSWALGTQHLGPWNLRNQWLLHALNRIGANTVQPRSHRAQEDAADVGRSILTLCRHMSMIAPSTPPSTNSSSPAAIPLSKSWAGVACENNEDELPTPTLSVSPRSPRKRDGRRQRSHQRQRQLSTSHQNVIPSNHSPFTV